MSAPKITVTVKGLVTVDILHVIPDAPLEDLDMVETLSATGNGGAVTVESLRAWVVEAIRSNDPNQLVLTKSDREHFRAFAWLALRGARPQPDVGEFAAFRDVRQSDVVFDLDLGNEEADPKAPELEHEGAPPAS
ncbi:hypothetical protein [Agromyces sp. SYSU T00194]|uniref:hypothetical protein n=1 Tax=Agromyces chitinivorans TaxID=3158560 RepID=UPI003395ACEB